jgi:hypothetical protein
MSANIVNAMNMIVNGFFAYAEEVGESKGLDLETIEGLKNLWTEEKEKIDEEMKKQVAEAFPKKTRAKKPKNAPKNAKSAYIFYCQDERPNVKTENPDLDAKEVLKVLGGKWKEADEETKAKYQKMSEEDKIRYADEMKTYVPSEDDEEKKPRKARAKKAKNAPKNASSPYIFFCKEEREKVKDEFPEFTVKEIMAELGKRWKAIKDTDDVEKYKKMAEEDKERFADEMKSYVPSDEEEKTRKPRVKKDKNAPKNVRSAYMFYCEKRRDVIKKKNPELKGKEITSKLSEEWKKIKDTDKAKKYLDMVEDDKKRHSKEMEEYNQKKHLLVSDDEDEDEELEEESEEKPESLENIITHIINNFKGDAITKGVIKKLLNEKKIEFTKEEFETALKKAQA